MAKAAPVVELTPDQVARLQQWVTAKDELSDVKNFEMEYRLAVVKELPFKADKEEGGQTVSLNAGWKLKLVKTMDYKMENKDNDAVKAALNALFAIEEDQDKAAHLIVRWEPVMSTEVYKSLSDAGKRAIANIVTVKPGAPQLTLSPPPAPKS